jgi:hypothetical protein
MGGFIFIGLTYWEKSKLCHRAFGIIEFGRVFGYNEGVFIGKIPNLNIIGSHIETAFHVIIKQPLTEK